MNKLGILLGLLFCLSFLQAQDLENIKEKEPFQISGALQLGAQFYNSNALNPRANPFMWQANGQVNIRLYEEWNIPISIALGQHRPELSYPIFNQVGLSPHYKWAKLHLGYRNMLFSKHTLNNHTFLGAGLELNPGKFRFAVMRGRLEQGSKEFDSGINYLYGIPIYNRMATAVKIGIGGSRSFFDLIFFQGQDQELDIPIPPPDSLLPGRAENTAIGFNWRQSIGEAFSFQLEATGSAYNRDQSSELFPVETIEQSPFLARIFQPRYSVELGTAVKGALNWQQKGTSLGLAYERIDPGFRTMGAYFLNSDLSSITANVGFGIANNKATVRSSFGLQKNNLYQTRAETSNRWVGSLNLSIQPKVTWGLDLNYSNFTQNHEPNQLIVLDDTIRIHTSTQNFGGNLRLLPAAAQGLSTIFLSSNFQRATNRNSFLESDQLVDAIFNNLGFNQRLSNTTTQFQLGLNQYAVKIDTINQNNFGFNVGMNQLLGNKKINLGISNTFNINRINGSQDGWTNSARINSNFKFANGYGLQLSVFWLKRNTMLARSFSEIRGRIQLSKSFTRKKAKRESALNPNI